jgi:predicted transcriptional regulator
LDDSTDRRVALLSIHPQLAAAILTGRKRVEFRRRSPSSATSHVIVYATAPVKRIVGWFRVEAFEAGSPSALWERFGDLGGIAAADFARYFEACDLGTAIRVADVSRVEPPAPIEAVGAGVCPPQSFRYIDWAAFEALRRLPVTS